MKKRVSKKVHTDPVEKRSDWMRLYMSAWNRVWVSGGPINEPYERVLQLLIRPWDGDHESWAVYRHGKDSRKNGKIVFKKWDYEADKERFRALGAKEAPKDWEATVSETQLTVPTRWLSALEQAVGKLSVPPIAGTIRPLRRETEFQLSFWRSRQESEFSWNPTPPAGWKPLARLFTELLRSFRAYANKRPLTPVDKLQF
jgi:hypothetical protein